MKKVENLQLISITLTVLCVFFASCAFSVTHICETISDKYDELNLDYNSLQNEYHKVVIENAEMKVQVSNYEHAIND